MNGLLSGQKSTTGPVTLPKSDAVYEISSALSYRMTRRSKERRVWLGVAVPPCLCNPPAKVETGTYDSIPA